MRAFLTTIVCCLAVIGLVFLAGSPASGQTEPAQPERLWDEFPLEPTTTPTPQPTPAATAQPQPQVVVRKADDGGGISQAILIPLLVGAASLGALAAHTAGRRRKRNARPKTIAIEAPPRALRAPDEIAARRRARLVLPENVSSVPPPVPGAAAAPARRQVAAREQKRYPGSVPPPAVEPRVEPVPVAREVQPVVADETVVSEAVAAEAAPAAKPAPKPRRTRRTKAAAKAAAAR